ncbi:hypothetical protein UK23_39160 [Lentzea aerocolonigenes]|uniref:ATP-binding protein n=1 Tax=Lentzea aerocolonigenes TaxID=68170 RepID=A0A0F0GJF6_LENAE|nr:hypothetical protein [Lentzea aerocolonigenes]KJK42037.1 hypothetical protein UK23_39160 [Lentzea aerocolonigenes]
MSRSGLLRAAALLAAGAAPLLAGSANAVEALPSLPGVPEVGADKTVSDASLPANPLESAGALKLGQVTTPVTPDGKTPALPAAAQERTAPNPVAPELGTLPSLPNAEALASGAHVGDLKAPALSDLPTNGIVPNPNVLSGTLPTING